MSLPAQQELCTARLLCQSCNANCLHSRDSPVVQQEIPSKGIHSGFWWAVQTCLHTQASSFQKVWRVKETCFPCSISKVFVVSCLSGDYVFAASACLVWYELCFDIYNLSKKKNKQNKNKLELVILIYELKDFYFLLCERGPHCVLHLVLLPLGSCWISEISGCRLVGLRRSSLSLWHDCVLKEKACDDIALLLSR